MFSSGLENSTIYLSLSVAPQSYCCWMFMVLLAGAFTPVHLSQSQA